MNQLPGGDRALKLVVGVTPCQFDSDIRHHKSSREKVRDHLVQNKAPDHHGRGLILSRNQVTSCLKLSGGSARESNPPTPLVTRHNGFEVRRGHRAPSTPIIKRVAPCLI
jgi:hypothetical protein